MILTVPVPLGSRLVLALKGLFITLIWCSTGRCARSVRSWAPNQALLLGAWLDILQILLAASVDSFHHWRRKQKC